MRIETFDPENPVIPLKVEGDTIYINHQGFAMLEQTWGMKNLEYFNGGFSYDGKRYVIIKNG